MTPRRWLVVLQILGALSLLIYPGILLANVMSLAAPPSPNPGLLDALVKGLLWVMLGYPLIWIVLWWLSWRVLRRGSTTLAFVLSTPPALFFAALGVVLLGGSFYGASMMRDYEASRSRVGQVVAAQNALAGSLLLYETEDVSWDALRSAIESADDTQLNTPVTVPMAEIPGLEVTTFEAVAIKPQSPLALALKHSNLDRSYDTATAQARFLEAARLMIGRGARLSEEEGRTDVRLAWMAEVLPRGVALPDPRAEQENVLVVRIMSADGSNEAEVSNLIHEYSRTRPELLMRATTTYGTPLRAALIRNATHHIESLLYTGALLSDAERAIPSVAYALEQFLAHPVNTTFRERHEESLRKAATASPRPAR